jgi:hypothetical protein
MPKKVNLIARQFDRLTVRAETGKSRSGRTRWVCVCSCEAKTVVVVAGCHLLSGHTRSCGCLRREITAARSALELTGQQFGQLTARAEAGKSRSGHTRWLCDCSCGRTAVVVGIALTRGTTRSCGCLRREMTAQRNRTHGLSHTRAYHCYKSAKQRCNNPNVRCYADYGGQGIKFLLPPIAQVFAELGECPEGMTLDRYPNNDGHYQLGNVRWATRAEQSRNRRPYKQRSRRSSLSDILAYARSMAVAGSNVQRCEGAP